MSEPCYTMVRPERERSDSCCCVTETESADKKRLRVEGTETIFKIAYAAFTHLETCIQVILWRTEQWTVKLRGSFESSDKILCCLPCCCEQQFIR